MKITKEQNFIYTIWVKLVIISSTILLILGNIRNSVFISELLYRGRHGYLIGVYVLEAVLVVYAWVIPAITTRDRKAWIRFLVILIIEMVYVPINFVFNFYGVTDGEMALALRYANYLHRLLFIAYMLLAIKLRGDVVEKSVWIQKGEKPTAFPEKKKSGAKKMNTETVWFWSVIISCAGFLMMGAYEVSRYYGFEIVQILLHMLVLTIPWLIAAFFLKNRKAWIRFLVVLAIEIAYGAMMIAFSDGVFSARITWNAVKYVAFFHRIALVIYILLATKVRGEMAEKRLGIKSGGNITSYSAGNESAKQWINNQKKKQEQRPKLDFEPVEHEEVIKTNYNRTLKMDLEQAPIVSEAVKQEAVKDEFVKEEAVTVDFVKTENVPNNAVTGESKEIKEKLDINLCSEDDFLSLPGMSLLSAKRAVELRETQGDYKSIDDFVARNAIKPHFMVRMESMIMVTEKQVKNAETPRRGRMLDL